MAVVKWRSSPSLGPYIPATGAITTTHPRNLRGHAVSANLCAFPPRGGRLGRSLICIRPLYIASVQGRAEAAGAELLRFSQTKLLACFTPLRMAADSEGPSLQQRFGSGVAALVIAGGLLSPFAADAGFQMPPIDR
eukprot:714610-Rhodomonas_salina.1